MKFYRRPDQTIIWKSDQGSGKISGDYSVEFEESPDGLELVFKFFNSGPRQPSPLPADPDSFTKLASICYFNPATSKRDADYVLGVARYLGPIFGVPADGVEPVIRENLEDWMSAAAVMEYACRCQAAAQGAEHYYAFDSDGFAVNVSRLGAADGFSFGEGFRLRAGGAYERYLLAYRGWKQIENDLLEDSVWEIRGLRKLEALSFISANDDEDLVGFNVEASARSGEFSQNLVPPNRRHEFTRMRDFLKDLKGKSPNDESRQAVHDSLSYMVQNIIRLHVSSINLTIATVRENNVEYQNLGPLFDAHLQKLWHTFAIQFTSSRTGICEECGRMFHVARKKKGSSVKRFCSDNCRWSAYGRIRKEKRALVTDAINEAAELFDLCDPAGFQCALEHVEARVREYDFTDKERGKWKEELLKRKAKAL